MNGEKLRPWNPFAPEEPRLPGPGRAGVRDRDRTDPPTTSRSRVSCSRRASSSPPPRSSIGLSGPLKWNRQQGLYIYRANRLVQHGGWSGVRGIDEHTKFARASIDFDTDLDEAFQINVAKMRVVLPPTLKQMLERPIHELCVLADDAYRRAANAGERKVSAKTSIDPGRRRWPRSGVALKAAMLEGRTPAELPATIASGLKATQSRARQVARSLSSARWPCTRPLSGHSWQSGALGVQTVGAETHQAQKRWPARSPRSRSRRATAIRPSLLRLDSQRLAALEEATGDPQGAGGRDDGFLAL